MTTKPVSSKKSAPVKKSGSATKPSAPKKSAAAKKSSLTERVTLDDVRVLIATWPETSEKISHGSPTWWGGKKTFASFHSDHHGDGRIALWIKAPLELRNDLVASDPVGLFVPPYVGPAGWIGVRLDQKVPRHVVEDMLERGYRMVAPKRALALLEGQPRTSKVGR